MKDGIVLRPMTSAEDVYPTRAAGPYRHFLGHDPEGAWVAVDGDSVAGVTLAPEREGVWALSLFAVAEGDRGLGRALLPAIGEADGHAGTEAR
jgi:hypothetical protein